MPHNMKKIILITLLLISSVAYSEGISVTSVISTSSFSSVTVPVGGIAIVPVLANFQGDSAYSVSWELNKYTTDSGTYNIVNISVNGFTGFPIATITTVVPISQISSISTWLFTLPELKRLKKK
jgi:hypothetical protein